MLVVDISQRATMKEVLEHPFLVSGETTQVIPDLLMSQVPEYQHVPLSMITVQPPDEDSPPPASPQSREDEVEPAN